jgi:hypothetical protein
MNGTRPLTLTTIVAALLGAGGLTGHASTLSSPSNPVELGRVKWHRDFEAAARQARETGKPILLLFQEVPG